MFSKTLLVKVDAKLLAMQLVCDAADQLNEPGTVLPVIKHLDPYSKMPMQIKQLPGGLTVYSVGNNQVDDGGSVLVQDASGTALDIGLAPCWMCRQKPRRPFPETIMPRHAGLVPERFKLM